MDTLELLVLLVIYPAIVAVPIGVLYLHSQSVIHLPVPETSHTQTGRIVLAWIKRLFGYSFLVPVVCLVLSQLLSAWEELGTWSFLAWLAGMPLLLVARMAALYIFFSRFSIRALLLSILTIGSLTSGITAGPGAIKIACGISLAIFLGGWVLLLEDFHPSKRWLAGRRHLLPRPSRNVRDPEKSPPT